jgi:hypothetical protein
MVKNRYGWIVILLMFSVVVAACGGGDKKDSGATTVPGNETAGPTSAFPPTWTPAPTLTPAPKVTIDYSYEQATEPPFPTSAAFPEGYVETPEPTVVNALTAPASFTITADKINDLLNPQFIVLTSYLQGVPVVTFLDGQVRIEATVYTTPGDANSARAIVITASAAIENGIVQLNLEQVTFADDNTPYEDALPGYLLGTVGTGINDVVRQHFLALSPSGGKYTATDLTITPEGIVITIAPSG